MDDIVKLINDVWAWMGPVVLIVLASICAHEAVQLVREVREWRKAHGIRRKAKKLRCSLDRSDIEDAFWMR